MRMFIAVLLVIKENEKELTSCETSKIANEMTLLDKNKRRRLSYANMGESQILIKFNI